MIRKEIPSTEWSRFLEAFTMQHDGWLVDVESVTSGRSSVEAKARPLEGVVPRLGTDEPRRVIVTVGGSIEKHQRIVVPEPETIHVRAENGVETGLEIESHDGSLTRIQFVSPVSPETIDGISA
ncbi:MAG: DUF5335 domain-containing protein [Acidobacteria bacterium]|nr:DUF5335 domain-containing protein [Acidobacteriota bacterium]